MVGVLCYKRGVCVRVCVCVCVFNSQRQIKNSRVNALDPSEKKRILTFGAGYVTLR